MSEQGDTNRFRAVSRPARLVPGEATGPARQETLFSRSERVLVTGGTGFVGSHLVEALVRRGFRVRLLLRRTSSLRWLEGVPVEYAYGDVRDKASLAGACVGVRSVFHFGGVTRAYTAGEFREANATGTRNLAEALAERGTPGGFFLYCSSLAAGGPGLAVERDPMPVRTEADPPAPVTPYGRSKLEGEIGLREVADAHGRFRHIILRPPAIYGPRDEAMLVFFRWIRDGILFQPRGVRPRLSLIYVQDLVDAALRAVDSGARGTYYVSDGGEYSWQEVAERAATLMDARIRTIEIARLVARMLAVLSEAWGAIVRSPAAFSRAKVEDVWHEHWVCSPAKAQRDWGFAPRVSLDEGLEETLHWYRRNQLL